MRLQDVGVIRRYGDDWKCLVPVDDKAMTPRARALAAALRAVRTNSALPGRELSKRIGYSHGTVSHWETGRRVPTVEDVVAFLAVAGVTGTEKDRIVELARHANEPNWLTTGMPGIPQQLAGAVECERAASKITEWCPMALPGLTQTTDYSRAQLTAAGLTAMEVEQRLMVKTSRREILTRRDPVELLAYIGQDALCDPVGSSLVMADQLRHLLELAERRNVTLRVIPPRIGWHPGLVGPFVLYEFPDAPPVLYFEHYSSGAFVPDKHDVDAYQAALQTMARVALPEGDARRLIGQIVQETEHQT